METMPIICEDSVQNNTYSFGEVFPALLILVVEDDGDAGRKRYLPDSELPGAPCDLPEAARSAKTLENKELEQSSVYA
jgi:hypothetical protein